MKPTVHMAFLVGASIIAFVIAVAIYTVAPPQIPLWYSLAVPEQQLAPTLTIFLFPAGITVIALLHLAFASRMRVIDPVLYTLALYVAYIPIGILYIALIHILTAIV